jgi:hypothetical protein
MLDEPVSNTQANAPNSFVENAALAWEARIARLVGAGSFGFWVTFVTICLFAGALLVLAPLKS